MKRSMFVGIAALAVAALVVGTMVYAGGEAATVACPCPYHGGSALMKDAKIAVQNTAEGVTITVTAANAEQVKAIQAAFANFGKSTNAACAMMDPANCQKMRTTGCCAVPAASGTAEGHQPACGR